MTAASSPAGCVALRLTIAAAVGVVLCPVPGWLLPDLPNYPVSIGFYLWGIGFAVAALLLAENRTRWSRLKRGVAVGLIAPATTAAAALTLIAVSHEGALGFLLLLTLAALFPFGVWPVLLVTIPCGILASYAYHLVAPKTCFPADRRSLRESTVTR